MAHTIFLPNLGVLSLIFRSAKLSFNVLPFKYAKTKLAAIQHFIIIYSLHFAYKLDIIFVSCQIQETILIPYWIGEGSYSCASAFNTIRLCNLEYLTNSVKKCLRLRCLYRRRYSKTRPSHRNVNKHRSEQTDRQS